MNIRQLDERDGHIPNQYKFLINLNNGTYSLLTTTSPYVSIPNRTYLDSINLWSEKLSSVVYQGE